MLQVQVGSNLNFTVGTWNYTESVEPIPSVIGFVVGSVVVAVPLIIVIVVIAALLLKYRSKKHKTQKM